MFSFQYSISYPKYPTVFQFLVDQFIVFFKNAFLQLQAMVPLWFFAKLSLQFPLCMQMVPSPELPCKASKPDHLLLLSALLFSASYLFWKFDHLVCLQPVQPCKGTISVFGRIPQWELTQSYVSSRYCKDFCVLFRNPWTRMIFIPICSYLNTFLLSAR